MKVSIGSALLLAILSSTMTLVFQEYRTQADVIALPGLRSGNQPGATAGGQAMALNAVGANAQTAAPIVAAAEAPGASTSSKAPGASANTSLVHGSCRFDRNLIDVIRNNSEIPAEYRAAAVSRAEALASGDPREMARVIQLMTGERIGWTLSRAPTHSRDDVWPSTGPWTGKVNGTGWTVQLAAGGAGGLDATLSGGDGDPTAATFLAEIRQCASDLGESLRSTSGQ